MDPHGRRLGNGAQVALFVFLLFLGFAVQDLFSRPYGVLHRSLVLLGLGVFVVVYVGLMRDRRPVTRPTLTGLALLAVIALVLAVDDTGEWAMMFIYVSAAAAFRLPPRVAAVAIAACAALAAATGFAAPYDAAVAAQYVVYTVAVGFMLLGFAQLLANVDELRAARDEIARLAVGEERLRFARDLHDLLGHSLSVIALKSELAGRLLRAEPERAAAELDDIRSVTRGALAEVRETVGGYRRMTLDAEIDGAEAALDAAGITASIERGRVALAPEVESVLAWAVREATTNVIRHSRARRCSIRVRAGLREADVEVVDDGAGLGGAAASGSGLAGLEERVRRQRGHLEAGPAPGGGFRLRVTVPVVP